MRSRSRSVGGTCPGMNQKEAACFSMGGTGRKKPGACWMVLGLEGGGGDGFMDTKSSAKLLDWPVLE